MKTIGLDDDTHASLKSYCAKHELTMNNFVRAALTYFRTTGINPTDPPESVKEELARMDKRLNQVIAFQRTFERESMLPLLTRIKELIATIEQSPTKSEQHNPIRPTFELQKSLEKIGTVDFEGVSRNIASLAAAYKELRNSLGNQYIDIENVLVKVLEHLERNGNQQQKKSLW